MSTQRGGIACVVDEGYCLIDVPQQFVKSTDDRECTEHCFAGARIGAPGSPVKCALGHFLSRAEAVEHGAPLEPARGQLRMHATSVTAIEVFAGLTDRFNSRAFSHLNHRNLRSFDKARKPEGQRDRYATDAEEVPSVSMLNRLERDPRRRL